MPVTQQNMQEPILQGQTNQTPIAEGIQKIINQRKGLGEYQGKGHLAKIEKCRNFFMQLKEKVQEFETFRKNLIAQEKAKSGDYYGYFKDDPTLIDRVKDATTTSVTEKLDECIAECDRLYARFNRDTVNISVVGLARQGKSCLLQSISGLKDSVIPTSNGGDCTGTTSIICNEPGTFVAHAEVCFFSTAEMLETMHKYIKEIGLNCAVGSFDGIPLLEYVVEQYDNDALPAFTAEQDSLFGHFRKYIEHFREYSHLVGSGSTKVSEEEIRRYVAQHDDEMNPTYQYLAVKEVRIYRQFNYPEAGQIQLVDTIGLGDTSLGIEEKMLNTMRNNSDASFLIKLPAATGAHWGTEDDKLYDLIANAMGTEMLDKWLYFVLNTSDVLGNQPSTQAVKNTIKRKHLHYVNLIEVDCMGKIDVQNKLLIPALQYLASNLSIVDNDLMKKATTLFSDCYTAYLNLYNKAQDIVIGSPQAKAELNLFANKRWKTIRDDISAAIGKLYLEYKDRSSEPSGRIVKAIANCRDNIYDFMPEPEWYEKQLMIMGKLHDAESVYIEGLHIVRTRVSASFENINYEELIPMQEALIEKVAEILFDDARWKEFYLQSASNKEASASWLTAFAKEKLKEYPILQSTIEYILSYRMSISDLLDYEVEKSLGILSPDSRQYEQLNLSEAKKQGADLSVKAMAQFISNTISNRIAKVRKQLKDADFAITKVPNHSLYARIRKFREKLIMTNEAMDELENFYITNAANIWSSDYKQAVANQKAFADMMAWIGMLSMEGNVIEDFKLNI